MLKSPNIQIEIQHPGIGVALPEHVPSDEQVAEALNIAFPEGLAVREKSGAFGKSSNAVVGTTIQTFTKNQGDLKKKISAKVSELQYNTEGMNPTASTFGFIAVDQLTDVQLQATVMPDTLQAMSHFQANYPAEAITENVSFGNDALGQFEDLVYDHGWNQEQDNENTAPIVELRSLLSSLSNVRLISLGVDDEKSEFKSLSHALVGNTPSGEMLVIDFSLVHTS